jgi:diguanylate cyclase (GGDEF)-like protein
MWSEIRPDYVKSDKHFIQNINLDPVKLQFVRSIQEIARNAGCRVIAEGIETHAELVTIRDLGVDFGQGYFFAHPQPIPETRLAPGILGTLGGLRPSGSPGNALLRQRHATVANLVKYVVPVSPETTNDVVFDMIEQDPQLNTIPVVNDSGIPIGLISRYAMIDRFARRYGKELFGKRACATLMEPTPLIVERNVSLHEISNRILAMEAYHLTLGFIVTASGKYIGIGSGHDLLREITQMQIAAARYANPLTQLPGNVPINEHIDHLLQQGQPFCACYFDLDHFKAYNDVYGFRSGDEMIKLVSRLLQEITDPEADFIGHIGGDDFLVLFRSPDWEMRCQMLLRKFAVASQTLYEAADIARGGIECEDRQGRRVLHPLASLSVGAVRVDDHYRTHHEVSAAVSFAKKQAKKVPGNALFIERRASQAGQETKIEACCAA